MKMQNEHVLLYNNIYRIENDEEFVNYAETFFNGSAFLRHPLDVILCDSLTNQAGSKNIFTRPVKA